MNPAKLHRNLPLIRRHLLVQGRSSRQAGKPLTPSPTTALDDRQREAALHPGGTLRLLAPAGSGKTRTLTERILALVRGAEPPGSILALAFNAKAAAEMGDRLAGTPAEGVQARTFHGLGYEIVRQAYGWRYREENEARFDARAAECIAGSIALPGHAGRRRKLIQQGIELVRRGKLDLLQLDGMFLYDGMEALPFGSIFEEIITCQQEEELLTFTDMVYFALRALVEDGGLRAHWQPRCSTILVDEFQDLNAAQMLLLQVLALPQNELFVVGDDDQLIYGWRGARVENILRFDEHYPDAETVVLETNYRSGRRLVRHARWLIENNRDRVRKDIRPRAGALPGEIEISLHDALSGQAGAAAAWIRGTALREGLGWDAFGLVFRTNRESAWLEGALEAAGIPFVPPAPADPDAGDSPPERVPGRATLLTVHKAKGVEFPYLVYFNLSRRGSGQDEEDERRVAYVGVTRAERGLLVTAERGRPSRFLVEYALNPAFGDFTEAFLERRLRAARLKACWRAGRRRDWLALLLEPLGLAGEGGDGPPGRETKNEPERGYGYAQPSKANSSPRCDDEDWESIDRLTTELRFRTALEISYRVIPDKRLPPQSPL